MKMAAWDRPGERTVTERLASQPTQSRLMETLTLTTGNRAALRDALGESCVRHLRTTGGDQAARKITVDIDPAGLSPRPELHAPAEVVDTLARRHEGVVSSECVAIGDELTATVSFVGQYGAVDGPTLVRAARFARDLAAELRLIRRQRIGGTRLSRCEIAVNARMG